MHSIDHDSFRFNFIALNIEIKIIILILKLNYVDFQFSYFLKQVMVQIHF